MDYIAQMYENKPERWSEDLQGVERWRYIINVFTRMRFLLHRQAVRFDCKLPLEQAPQELLAWFDLDNPLFTMWKNIIFGHWASLLGKCIVQTSMHLIPAVLGGSHLTMLRWEDKQILYPKASKIKHLTKSILH